MKQKQKKYLVKYQGVLKEIITGLEMSLLQQSGASVKKIREATEDDLKNYPER